MGVKSESGDVVVQSHRLMNEVRLCILSLGLVRGAIPPSSVRINMRIGLDNYQKASYICRA